MKNQCKNCKLETKSNRHTFCCKECKDHYIFDFLECKTCKNIFKTSKRKRKQFCSVKCSSSNRTVINKMVETRKRVFFEKYGVNSYTQTTEFKEKTKITNLEKYGVEYPQQNKEIRNKSKITNIARYGNEMASKNIDIIEKIKQTKYSKYGDKSYNNLELSRKTKLNKYGDENYNNINKRKVTCISNYGVDNVSKCYAIQEKIKKNHLEKFYTFLITNDKIRSLITPLFTRNEYKGVYSDTNRYLYKFNCKICNNNFECKLGSGSFPRCTICYPKSISIPQLEIVDYIKSISSESEIIQNTRDIISPLEIDIYIPSKLFAIEFDGIYWHSEISGEKDKYYHLNKTTKCEAKGISLLHIWDWEWITKQDIIKSIISTKLQKNKKIYARKCKVKDITENEKNKFLKENHLQGSDRSSIKLGLYYENELVFVMTFSKSRFDKNYEYELCRCATKINIIITGGASKLFSYFLQKYNPNSIVSYCDRRFFSGNMYIKLGMQLVSTPSPSYHYLSENDCVPINRLQFQKHKLSSLLSNYDPNLTEWQNMQLNGYDRIWDCGNFKYEWKKNNINAISI